MDKWEAKVAESLDLKIMFTALIHECLVQWFQEFLINPKLP